MSDNDQILDEAFKIRVDAKANKRRRLICGPGMKPNEAGTSCVPMRADEKRNRRLGLRRGNINKKAQGSGLKRRTLIKQRKALRFRKMMGVK